jgi:hypothetical protein
LIVAESKQLGDFYGLIDFSSQGAQFTEEQ